MGRDSACSAYSLLQSLQEPTYCPVSMYGAIEYQHCKVTDPKLNAAGKANPNPLVECQQCESRFAGGPYRIRGHILRISNRGGGICTSNTPAAVEARAMFQKVEDEMAATNKKKRKREELDELTNGSGTGASTDGLVQLSLEQAFAPCLKDKADEAVARFFYGDGVAFCKVDGDYFQEMLTAVAAYGPGYSAPGSKRLRTSLLDKEVENVKDRLKVRGERSPRTCAALLLHVYLALHSAVHLRYVLFCAAIPCGDE